MKNVCEIRRNPGCTRPHELFVENEYQHWLKAIKCDDRLSKLPDKINKQVQQQSGNWQYTPGNREKSGGI